MERMDDGGTLARRALGELVGTLVLVYAVAMAATSTTIGGDARGVTALVVALTHGLVFAGLLSASLHGNPAVTVAALVTNRIGGAKATVALAGQVLGGIAGAALARTSVSEALWKQADLGAPKVASDLGISTGQAVLIESVLVGAVVWALFALVSRDDDTPGPASAFVVGGILVAGILASWQFTGGSLNPARALGPAVAGGFWDDQWVYWAGPIAGAVVAGVAVDLLARRGRDDIVLD